MLVNAGSVLVAGSGGAVVKKSELLAMASDDDAPDVHTVRAGRLARSDDASDALRVLHARSSARDVLLAAASTREPRKPAP